MRGTVTLAVLFIATIVPFQKIRMLLLNEKFAVTALIMSALVVFVMGQILKNEFINNIVFGYFNRSYTVTGRSVCCLGATRLQRECNRRV